MAHCRLFVRQGGLADTVTNCTSGTIEAKVPQQALYSKSWKQMIYEVLSSMLYLVAKQRVWARIRNNAMAQDFS